jgi:hypothetical protein
MTPFRYISWGCGLQSTVLVEMVREGTLLADAIFFADTGDEPHWVYKTLEFYRTRCVTPVHVATKGKLSDHIRAAAEEGRRWATIPLWTLTSDGSAGPLRRQCTREYKIDVIEKAVRRLLGYQMGERCKHKAVCIQGISFDELNRMRPNRTPWITNEYPLVDAGMTRTDCREFFESRKLPVPRKSSCRYCPYHSDSYWRALKQNDPAEFEQACQTDEISRNLTRVGVTNPAFVHRSLVPLREAYFGEDQRELFGDDCGGHCGV